MSFPRLTIQNIFVKSWRPYAWIGGLGFLLYQRTVSADLTYLDDNVWILDYPWFMGDLRHIAQLFSRPDFVSKMFYRPVLGLSFMVNAFYGGQNPFIFHLTNILIHLVNSCLVFVLFQQLAYKRGLSLSGALVFLVHPVLTQAVAWIPGRTDSLLGLFLFLSFLFYLRGLKRPGALIAWGGHLFFFGLALLTKETAVVFPLVCWMYFALVHRHTARASFRSLVWLSISWLLLTGIWFAGRHQVLAGSPPLAGAEAVQSVLHNLPALIIYAGKMMCPVNLSVLPILDDMSSTIGWVSLGVLLLALVLSKQKRMPYVLWAALGAGLFLLPSLVFSFIKHEYRVYLSLPLLIGLWMETDFVKWLSDKPRMGPCFAASLIFLLAGTSFVYSGNFRDRMTFWRAAVRTSPHSPLAHRNLGAMYYLDGKTDQAAEAYRQALALNPNEKMVYNNLGIIYQQQGRLPQAEQAYVEEIRRHPFYTDAYYNLGLLYYSQGKVRKAEALWKKVIDLDDRYLSAYRHLIQLYTRTKQPERAQPYRKALKERGALQAK